MNLAGNPELAYLVAREAAVPVALRFVDVSHDTGARAHVLVVPDARRRGIGTALLVAVSDYARASRRVQLEASIRALTAVKRAWRRRGIATALKLAQIGAARRSGLARLVTTNEERNTAMRSINHALGYRPELRLSTIVVRGALLRLEAEA